MSKIKIPLPCLHVFQHISNYLENDLDPETRARMEAHFRECSHCTAVLDGTRNVLRLVSDDRSFELPAGFSQRLEERLSGYLQGKAAAGKYPLGVRGEYVNPGDHIAYFWEHEREFEEAVGFLEVGLRGKDSCFVFGHEQANRKVLEILAKRGHDVEALTRRGRLTVLGGKASGAAMLEEIGAAFGKALASGAPLVRLLGNIGWGRPDWPSDDAILEFESTVNQAVRNLPAVVVCMYDVAALPGRLILRGGFETHPLTVCDELVENPHYLTHDHFLSRLRGPAASKRVQ
ncbi:MAG: MEDS domain-containing protein [Terriglobales bacterium]